MMKKLMLLSLLSFITVFGKAPSSVAVQEKVFKSCVKQFCQKEQESFDNLKKSRVSNPEMYKKTEKAYQDCIKNHCMTKESIAAQIVPIVASLSQGMARTGTIEQLKAILNMYGQYEPDHPLTMNQVLFLEQFILADHTKRVETIKTQTKNMPNHVLYLIAALMQRNPIEFIQNYRLEDKTKWMGMLIATM
jgi:hypothetical protein